MGSFTLDTISSTPSFSEIDPYVIPWQGQLVNDMEAFDYTLGTHEILLSGSVGSAKSIIAAHLGVKHCIENPGARLLIGRRAMPDLRDTIYNKIKEHLEGTNYADGTPFKEGVDYRCTDTICRIKFANGSEIIAKSWADKNYKKLGSIEISAAIIEELTENDDKDEMAIKYVRMRVGRLPHVKQNFIIYCTNPDSPSHFAYDYFDIGKRQAGLTKHLPKTRHVYFSITEQNPFLPDWYITQLEEDLDPKLARRMLKGEWLEITTDVIYHSYTEEKNHRDCDYDISPLANIYVCFDFNIGVGKPMSACMHQYFEDTYHFFAESIVEGADTEMQMEEMAARGFFDHPVDYVIHGDATGASRTTKSNRSDYDIIREFLSKYRTPDGNRVSFTIEVPKANPPIRDRHNWVNAYCKNATGKVRLLTYNGAKTLNKGFKLTSLKKKASYIEDDSKEYQHVTTAAGYSICKLHKAKKSNTGMRTQRTR